MVQETNSWHMPSVTWALDHGNSLDIGSIRWFRVGSTHIIDIAVTRWFLFQKITSKYLCLLTLIIITLIIRIM
jgi:hypothetical protein